MLSKINHFMQSTRIHLFNLIKQAAVIGFSIVAITGCQFLPSKADSNEISESERKSAEDTADRILLTGYELISQRTPITALKIGIPTEPSFLGSYDQTYINQTIERQHAVMNEIKAVQWQALTAEKAQSLAHLNHYLMLENWTLSHPEFYSPIGQSFGIDLEIEQYLHDLNIESTKDANRYINKVKDYSRLIDELANYLNRHEEIFLSRNSALGLIERLETKSAGYPLNRSNRQHPLYDDFSVKVDRLAIYPESKSILKKELRKVLTRQYKYAFRDLTRAVQKLSRTRPNHLTFASVKVENADPDVVTTVLEKSFIGDLQNVDYLAQLETLLQQTNTELGLFNPTTGELAQPNSSWYHSNTADDESLVLVSLKERLQDNNERLNRWVSKYPSIKLGVKKETDHSPEFWPIHYAAASFDLTKRGNLVLHPKDLYRLPKGGAELFAFLYGLPGRHLQWSLLIESSIEPPLTPIIEDPGFVDLWTMLAADAAMVDSRNPDVKRARLLLLKHQLSLAILAIKVHKFDWQQEQANAWLTAQSQLTTTDRNELIRSVYEQPIEFIRGPLAYLLFNNKQPDNALTSLWENKNKTLDELLKKNGQPISIN